MSKTRKTLDSNPPSKEKQTRDKINKEIQIYGYKYYNMYQTSRMSVYTLYETFGVWNL